VELAKVLVVGAIALVVGVALGEHWEHAKHRQVCPCALCTAWRRFNR